MSRYKWNITSINTIYFSCSSLDCLLNVFTVYAPHSGKPYEEKESFWNEVFQLVRCIPQNEMVVFAGDMNGHIGSSYDGYDAIT